MKMNEKHCGCEPKTKNTLYKIGLFAAMTQVSVKTLRFYEEENLVVPAHINYENGYRYYELSQISLIHQITALKKAGFTLEEIARINSGADKRSVLLRKKHELLDKIASLTKKLTIIESYIDDEENALCAPVLVKTVPEVNVAYMSVTLDDYDSLFYLMPKMGALMEKCGCKCALPEYNFTNYLDDAGKDENIKVEICEAVTECRTETEGLCFKKMPAVQAACIFHKGSYSSLPKSYKTVLKYIEENRYKIAGEIRESYIDGVWNKDDESEWLTEIQIPIEKA